MARIVLVCDSDERASELISRLGNAFNFKYAPLHQLPQTEPAQIALVDVDLRRARQIDTLQRWIKRQAPNSKTIFVVDPTSRFDLIQAAAFGASAKLSRPVKSDQLTSLISSPSAVTHLPIEFDGPAGVVQVRLVKALQSAFASTISGGEFDLKLLQDAGAEVVFQMEEEGLQSWLETVRRHHSLTYQHCMIVTAVAVTFGQHLSFNKRDRERLASAALLHDIGKAKIPVEILEKAGPLTAEEWVIMRMHPELGVQALENSPGLAPEMLDIVRSHHELLDGSGYPYGLAGSQIPDLVRVLTICDIYGALIEKRAYKAPMSGAEAYNVLKSMGSKLDRDMVREFERLTLTVF